MAYILGIDTGGTYTDGVIYDESRSMVLSKGKALTTRQNLSIGIANCLQKLDHRYFPFLSQVSLSTTLATNAIVEHRGNKIALVMLGTEPQETYPAEYVVSVEGKCDIRGRQEVPLNEEQVVHAAMHLKDRVGAFALSGFASCRNNRHEQKARSLIQEATGLPVVCAHEMSSRLGYHDRTVTTCLNARLLSVIYELIKAVRAVLRENDLDIPLMIVTGSGSLVSEQVAMERPVETVLSGPAASITGAMHLADQTDGLVFDMGGTTSDLALVHDGKVKLNDQGATVSGYHLHIDAPDIYTYGLGGDSRIFIGPENKLLIGPNKVHPVCRAAEEYPELFKEMKSMQKEAGRRKDRRNLLDGFMLYLHENCSDLNYAQEKIIQLLKDAPHTMLYLMTETGDLMRPEDLEELEEKGVVMRIAFTPTDVLHALGEWCEWNEEASLFFGESMAQIYGLRTPEFLRHCRSLVEQRMAYCCQNSENDRTVPIVGVGAPIGAWMPQAAERLQQTCVLPEHHEVANAVGAAIAAVSESARALIRYNSVTGSYMLFLPDGRFEFPEFEEAKCFGRDHLKVFVSEKAKNAGCDSARVIMSENEMDFEEEMIEFEIFATAEGKSRWVV